MKKDVNLLEEQLNDTDKAARLNALRQLIDLEESGEIQAPKALDYVNNHIHTTYSFSPYSPTAALYYARKAGLATAGIMDHDSVGGCREFVEAGAIAGIPITVGFETRVKMDQTSLNGRTLNNPDQKSVAYVAAHGIPHQKLMDCEAFLAPYREHRNDRNRKMVDKINKIIVVFGLSLDFEKDVLPLSLSHEGGSITERHILCGLANVVTEKFGRGTKTVDFLKNSLQISISSKVEEYLSDDDNPHYMYDLLGAFKSGFVERFYIEADEECPDVKEFVAFIDEIGAISAYAYLGDVANSVTGDKKEQKFEDDFLDEVFAVIKQLGFKAFTYMPSRNTLEQLQRAMGLCEQYDLFQISGEDINTSRQSFICPALEKPEFSHLTTATWVLIGHEIAASLDIGDGLFGVNTKEKYSSLGERMTVFEAIGMGR